MNSSYNYNNYWDNAPNLMDLFGLAPVTTEDPFSLINTDFTNFTSFDTQ
jgi:hypothetical protein